MYFGTARLFDGGHESAGVPAGAQSWFLAEGATGPFFETFILIGNPNPAAATVTLHVPDRRRPDRRRATRPCPPNGRLTINIENEDPILANAAVSTAVVASQPVVVERAMYWPGPPSTWAEAHNSFGSTVVSARSGAWPKGASAWTTAFETYILLANPNTTAANVTDHVPARERLDGGEDVHGEPELALQRGTRAAPRPELQNEEFGA